MLGALDLLYHQHHHNHHKKQAKKKMQISTTISMQRLLDLVITALDGGISYWAPTYTTTFPDGFNIADLTWLEDPEDWEVKENLEQYENVRLDYFAPLVEGGSINLEDAEDPDSNPKPITLQSLQAALAIMANDKDLSRHFADILSEDEDAITADVLFQIAAFGELVYG